MLFDLSIFTGFSQLVLQPSPNSDRACVLYPIVHWKEKQTVSGACPRARCQLGRRTAATLGVQESAGARAGICYTRAGRFMKPALVSEASQQGAQPLLLPGWSKSRRIFFFPMYLVACIQTSAVTQQPDSQEAPLCWSKPLPSAGSSLVTAICTHICTLQLDKPR